MRKFFSGIVVVLLLLMGTVWSAGKEPEAVQTIGNKAARLVAGEGMLRLMEQELMEQSQAHPEVALTFDDGPSPKYTPLLLDGLKERNVQATFFLLGQNVKENQELVQRMQAEGHLLGNHTYNHVQLNKIPETTARQEILKTNNEIYEVTGKYPEYMRPPYGAWKKNMELCVEMLPVFWDIDTLDWKSQNVDAILKAAGEEPEDGSIILMHDEYQTSVEAALLLIDRLKEKGYEVFLCSYMAGDIERRYRFRHYLSEVFKRKIFMKSGGFLYIEQTEAMAVIDVNTGKSIGKKNQEAHIKKINLEAAKEAARQIRLRNLSGIIMIDFIDMKSKDDEKELLQVMQHYLNGDSKKAVAVDITKLGIMEITRKKEKNPIFRQISIDILK